MDDRMDQTHATVVMVNMWLQIKKIKKIKHAAVILHPYDAKLQRLVKIYYLSLDFLTSYQSVSIRKTRFLTFSFITSNNLDVLDKSRYQDNTSLSTYPGLDHWGWRSYDNPSSKPLSKLF